MAIRHACVMVDTSGMAAGLWLSRCSCCTCDNPSWTSCAALEATERRQGSGQKSGAHPQWPYRSDLSETAVTSMPCWSSPDHRLGQMKPKPHEPVCSGHASLRHRRYKCNQLIGQAALKY